MHHNASSSFSLCRIVTDLIGLFSKCVSAADQEGANQGQNDAAALNNNYLLT
jgi:hypothetical protein